MQICTTELQKGGWQRQALERRPSIRTYLCTADNPPGSGGASERVHTEGHGARKAKERRALNPNLVRSIIIVLLTT